MSRNSELYWIKIVWRWLRLMTTSSVLVGAQCYHTPSLKHSEPDRVSGMDFCSDTASDVGRCANMRLIRRVCSPVIKGGRVECSGNQTRPKYRTCGGGWIELHLMSQVQHFIC